jgi:hypothetical protein
VVLGDKFAKLAVVPVPVRVAPPGNAVTVQVPIAGNPLKATDPAEVQVVWVIVPIVGAVGLLNETVTVAVELLQGAIPLTV